MKDEGLVVVSQLKSRGRGVMMESVLSQSGETIKRVVQMIQTLTKFDFSIVDENYKRLLGTGRFHIYENMTLPTSTMTAQVIRTGDHLITHEVRNSPICETCELRNICEGESTIIYPIKKGNNILGAISILAFDEEQKIELKKNESKYFDYIIDVADFIYDLAMEKSVNTRLKEALNIVDKGVVLSDHSGKIIYYNKNIDHIYGINENKLEWMNDIFPEYDFNKILAVINTDDKGEIVTNVVFDNVRYKLTIRKVLSQKEFDLLYLLEVSQNESNVNEQVTDKNRLSDLNHIVGTSEAIIACKNTILSAANCDSNVLIQGESGTGKEVFVRALHHISIRKNGPLVAVNCSAIPENLIESELFGYEEGSFTGSSKGGKIGKFEQANNGTLFLDEIGDMPFHLQAKILRAIEYGQIEKIGSSKTIHLNIRIVAATNKPLEDMIYEKLFRKDLYYRLNVIQMNIPPLRDRREDIISLARHFLRKFNNKFSKEISGFTKEVEEILLLNDWPGNIRELENVLEYAIHIEKSSIITKSSLPKSMLDGKYNRNNLKIENLKSYEKNSIEELIEIHGSTLEGKKRIAAILGISLSTLYRRIRKLEK